MSQSESLCSVNHCESTSESRKITLFALPKITHENKRIDQWLSRIKLKQGIKQNIKVCNLHFEDICFLFDTTTQQIVLTKEAVPTKKLGLKAYHNKTPKRAEISKFELKIARCETISSIPATDPITRTCTKTTEVCRICLENKECKYCLLDSYFGETIQDLIRFATSIPMPVTPSSPQSICTSCFDTLKISSDFKKTCLESNEIFNENFQVEESQISDLHVPDMFDFIEVSNGCQTGENQVSDDEMDVVDNAPDESSEEKFLDKMLDAKTRFMQMMDQCKEGTNQSGRGSTFRCSLCTMDFPVASLQKMHMEEKHKVGDNFVCTKCPETSKDVTNFLKHLYNHDKPRIICDHCGKGFRNLSQLKYHAVSHYSGEKKDALKPFTCEVCGLKVIDSYKLKLHQQCHTNVKLFKCDFCPSEFSKRMSLRRHLLKHGVKAEFTCHSCHRGFVVHHEYVHHFNNCNNKIILKSVNT